MRSAFPQAFACTIPLVGLHIVSDLYLQSLGKLLLFAWLRAWVCCHQSETESTLGNNRVHHFRLWRSFDPRTSPNFSPWLRDKIWVGPGDEATKHTLVQVSRTDSTLRCSHFYSSGCTVNCLHIMYKLPRPRLIIMLTWYVAYSWVLTIQVRVRRIPMCNFMT